MLPGASTLANPTLDLSVGSDSSVAGVSRFDLEAHSRRVAKNRRSRTYFLGGVGVCLLAIGVVQIAYLGALNSMTGLLETGYFAAIAVVCLAGALFIRQARDPVALLVRPDGLVFEYADHRMKTLDWTSPTFYVRLLDQRGIANERWYSELTPFAGMFAGLPRVSSLVMLPEAAVGTILNTARERGLTVDSTVSRGGRRQPPTGTRVMSVYPGQGRV